MSPKTILISVPVGCCALGLLWAALAVRGEPEPNTAKLPPRRGTARSAPETSAAQERMSAISYGAPPPLVPAEPAAGGGEYPIIEERIRKMEERLLALEAKKTSLSGSNQEMERQISEKIAEQSARTQAEWRVRAWEALLGLSETQKQMLVDLLTQWGKEDAGHPADRETWLLRESELRSRLSVEQAAKLHESSVTQGQQMWNFLGRSIGSMIGASRDEMTRFQQVLGDYRVPSAMLLPEGYGSDWPGMLREGASRLQPVLSSDQMAKLGRFIQR
ncbi:MAG TPA: hypothetical protein VMU54_26390 [Planctomycetota bacterium]|nr:hypothetical protein [Planctomycetota bacterium]